MSSSERGVLDLLDEADDLFGQIRLVETIDRSLIRQWDILLRNGRARLLEARRRIERTDNVTPT
jgi:hypothetical protein